MQAMVKRTIEGEKWRKTEVFDLEAEEIKVQDGCLDLTLSAAGSDEHFTGTVCSVNVYGRDVAIVAIDSSGVVVNAWGGYKVTVSDTASILRALALSDDIAPRRALSDSDLPSLDSSL